MNPPDTPASILDCHQRRLVRIASIGYETSGRGAVVVFSDSDCRCAPGRWRGTEHPYFLEGCLLRQLIHNVWLRNCPLRCRKTVADLVEQISSYDPSEGMIVVVLAADGAVWIRHVLFDSMARRPSMAA